MSQSVKPFPRKVALGQRPPPNIATLPFWNAVKMSPIGLGAGAIPSSIRPLRKVTASNTAGLLAVAAETSSLTRLPPALATHGRIPGKISLLVQVNPYWSVFPAPSLSLVRALAVSRNLSQVQSAVGSGRPASANSFLL